MPRYNLILEAPAIGMTAIVEAENDLEAIAKAQLEHHGYTVRSAKLIPEGFEPAAAKQTFRVGLNVPAPGSCRLVNASSAEDAIAIVNRDNPGLASGAEPLFDRAAAAARALADKRSSDDGLREARLEELLGRAESFIAGFEGDDTQEEPVDDLLEAIREELAA